MHFDYPYSIALTDSVECRLRVQEELDAAQEKWPSIPVEYADVLATAEKAERMRQFFMLPEAVAEGLSLIQARFAGEGFTEVLAIVITYRKGVWHLAPTGVAQMNEGYLLAGKEISTTMKCTSLQRSMLIRAFACFLGMPEEDRDLLNTALDMTVGDLTGDTSSLFGDLPF